ncbi:MAG: hypothetical protein ACLFV3_09175 [Phycisphaeraceae bacterium]
MDRTLTLIACLLALTVLGVAVAADVAVTDTLTLREAPTQPLEQELVDTSTGETLFIVRTYRDSAGELDRLVWERPTDGARFTIKNSRPRT